MIKKTYNQRFKWKFFFSMVFVMAALCACSYLPEGELHPENIIINETAEYIELSLEDANSDAIENGILFYPGGLVDAHAYIETLSGLASYTTKLIILKVNSNLAILEINKAEKVRKKFPEIKSWFTAGHSLGGLAAVATAKKYPEVYDGIILLAAYPNKSNDISNWSGNVLSLYGSNDKVATVSDIDANKEYLPPGRDVDPLWPFSYELLEGNTTYYYLMQGANHSQFGAYGFQSGDGAADITADEQKIFITLFVNAFIAKSL